MEITGSSAFCARIRPQRSISQEMTETSLREAKIQFRQIVVPSGNSPPCALQEQANDPRCLERDESERSNNVQLVPIP
jgi:hypothetical protein